MNHRPWHGRPIGGRTYFARRLRRVGDGVTFDLEGARHERSENGTDHTVMLRGAMRWSMN